MSRGKRGSQRSVSRKTGQAKAPDDKTVTPTGLPEDGLQGEGRVQGMGILRSKGYVVPLFIALVSLAVYWQVVGHEFIYFDDRLYVFENSHVLKGMSWESVLWAFGFSGKDQPYWHPLTWLSHMADVQMFGIDSGKHHLMNVMIHIANVLLLFFVLRLMTGEVWKSGFVAALFALHPVNVDTVAWVAERKNLLSTFFWLLVMLSYYYYAKRPGVMRYGVVAGVLVLGLLSKPMLVTLPFVLLLLDYWPLGRVRIGQEAFGDRAGIKGREIRSLREFLLSPAFLDKIPLIVLSLVSVSLSMFSLQVGGNPVSLEEVSLGLRIENGIVSYVGYIREAILPYGLAVYYPFPREVPLWKVLLSLVLLISITAGAVLSIRKRAYVLVGWLWFVGTLVPVSGIVQAGLWPSMADRWAYVPFMGLFIMAAWGVPELVKSLSAKREILGASAAVVLLVLTFLTWRQTGFWKDNLTLFKHTSDVTVDNAWAYNKVALALMEKGSFEEAVSYLEMAVKVSPYNENYRCNLIAALKKAGREKDAEDQCRVSLGIKSDSPDAHNKLGAYLIRLGKIPEAIQHLSIALKQRPGWAEAHNNLGLALESQGKIADAIGEYKRALEIDPRYVDAHVNIGTALSSLGKNDEATAHYREAIRIKPDSVEARIGLADLLVNESRIDEAVGILREAVRQNPGSAEAHNALGVALARRGDFEGAVGQFQESLKIDPGNENARIYLTRVRDRMAKQ